MWQTMMASALGGANAMGVGGAAAGAGAGAAAGASGVGSMLAGLGSSVAAQGTGWGLGDLAAKKAFKRQKKILNNQIQWRVGDMRAAGINPLLAVGGGFGGGGASVPMGTTSAVDYAGAMDKYVKAKTGKNMMDFLVKKIEADIRGVEAGNVRDTATAAAQWNLAKVHREQAGINELQRDLLIRNIPSAKAISDFDATPLGQWLIKVGRGLQSILPILGKIGGK